MRLKEIRLENFRNYDRYDLTFPEGKDFTIIVGSNGKGKTNLLEAIYTLSLGRSFRTLSKEDLISWKMDYMRCQGTVETDEEISELEIFYSTYPRKELNFKKNEVKLKNSEYLGNLLTVLFHPEDLNMLYLSPILRRKYINILLSQTDRLYLEALTNYKKIIIQRNILLQEINQKQYRKINTSYLEDDLSAWDEKLSEFGSYIILKRIELIEFFNKRLEKNYHTISGNNEIVKVKYINSITKDLKSPAPKIISTTPTDISKSEEQLNFLHEIHKNYKTKLSAQRAKDIKDSKTTIGPHRDDLSFYINNQEISHAASRGEFRTLLLAIKLAEIDFIKLKTKKNPILLLDDVFSELDKKRQIHLLEAIKGCQTLISTTDIGNLGELETENKNTVIVKLK